MLRVAPRTLQLRLPVRPQYRSFVSSVLLTRTYANESVAELKKLAKERGLPVKGNKATLITRIQEHDQQQTLQAISAQDPPAVPAGVQARHASSAAPTTSGSEISGPVPGIPAAVQPNVSLSKSAFTNVNLPDLSQPDIEWPTPIPFYPDFYDSIHHPTPYKTVPDEPLSDLPKVVVVAGSSTHHGGGPTHNAHDGPESSERHEHETPSSRAATESASASASAATTQAVGFWRDIADDVGLPSSWKRGELTDGQKAVLDSLLETTGSSSTRQKDHSRALDQEEVRGVWILVSMLGGSWLLGGLFN